MDRFKNSKDEEQLYSTISDTEYIKIIIEYLEKKGLQPSSYRLKYFTRRLQNNLRKLGIDSYKIYYNLLMRSPDELESLKKNFSIIFTRFYRNKDTWNHIEREILPRLFRKSNHKIIIWSAGCADGSEAYSLAMACEEAKSFMKRKNIKYEIVATDLNQEMLLFAEKGIYNDESLRELDETQIEKYFYPQIVSDENKVKPCLRNKITWKQHDLFGKIPFSERKIDLILCRNVVIYFSRAEHVTLYNKFSDVLREDGILILGRTENISKAFSFNLAPIHARHRSYQRISDNEANEIKSQMGKIRILGAEFLDKKKNKKKLVQKERILQKHALTSKITSKKYFKCEICGKNFHFRISWDLHMKEHKKQQIIKCKYCGKIFATRARLQMHENNNECSVYNTPESK